MSIKNPIWLLLLSAILAFLGHYGYVPWYIVLVSFALYVFSLGLRVEFDEIRAIESLESFFEAKIANLEKSVSSALRKVESDERIMTRLSQKRREVIEWLDKF